MTPILWLCALLVCLLLVLACFFAGAEAALTAASPARLLALARGGNHRARRVNRLLETRETTIGALLIGARVSEAAAAALATAALVAAFEAAGLVYALLVVTGPIVVLAEVLPRLIAVAHPERLALALSRPVDLAQALLRPIFALST